MERGGLIMDLEYQVKFILSEKNPKIAVSIDFSYYDPAVSIVRIYEDTKGVLTRDFRTKMAWLKEQMGISVRLTQ